MCRVLPYTQALTEIRLRSPEAFSVSCSKTRTMIAAKTTQIINVLQLFGRRGLQNAQQTSESALSHVKPSAPRVFSSAYLLTLGVVKIRGRGHNRNVSGSHRRSLRGESGTSKTTSNILQKEKENHVRRGFCYSTDVLHG